MVPCLYITQVFFPKWDCNLRIVNALRSVYMSDFFGCVALVCFRWLNWVVFDM